MVDPARHRLPYRLLKSLGRGGYAEVFEAEPRGAPGERVAFKRPHDTSEARERMGREIAVQRRLRSDHIMPILNWSPDSAWFVMPLALGNLEDLWRAGAIGKEAEALATDVLVQISTGLGTAHGQGFVHRDVSPRNILALGTGPPGNIVWVVADWGLVRRPPGETTHLLTEPGQGLGTRGFAAPETWEDAHETDPRADIYSLGRVAAWLLTGQRPAPNIALLPEGRLRGVVHECTVADPDRRIGTMADLRTRLEILTATRTLSARGEVEALVDETIEIGAENELHIAELALANPEDDTLYIDEVGRMPHSAVWRLAGQRPEMAATLAGNLLGHLVTADWGYRDFNYANTPLRLAHEAVKALLDEGRMGLAEDLAVESFRAEQQWNRFNQHAITLAWLKALPEAHGEVIARAMRRAGAHDYYREGLAVGRLASRSLAAEMGF